MLVFRTQTFSRKHSLQVTWPIDLFKLLSVEPLKMIEITTVRRDLIWQVLSSVTFSDKSLEKSSLKCKKVSKRTSVTKEKILKPDCLCSRITSKLTQYLEVSEQLWPQETGVKIKMEKSWKRVSLRSSIDWLLPLSCLILEELLLLSIRKVSRQSLDSFITLIGVWFAQQKLLKVVLAVLSKT